MKNLNSNCPVLELSSWSFPIVSKINFFSPWKLVSRELGQRFLYRRTALLQFCLINFLKKWTWTWCWRALLEANNTKWYGATSNKQQLKAVLWKKAKKNRAIMPFPHSQQTQAQTLRSKASSESKFYQDRYVTCIHHALCIISSFFLHHTL